MSEEVIRRGDNLLLGELLNTNSFLSTNVDSFRTKVRLCLGELLREATTARKSVGASLIHYDFDFITASFQEKSRIDWVELMTEHDKQYPVSLQAPQAPPPTAGTTNTILTLLLQQINDPSSWPVACRMPVLISLVGALLDHASTLKDQRRSQSSAQRCIRHFIVQSLVRIPAMRKDQTIQLLLSLEKPTRNGVAVSSAAILIRIQLKMSLLKEWITELPTWPRHWFVPTFCQIFNTLDELEIQEMGKKYEQSFEMDRSTKKSKRTLMSSTTFVDYLHGDMDQTANDSPARNVSSSMRGHYRYISSAGTQSVQKVLQSTLGQNAERCFSKEDWVTRQRLRTKCIVRIQQLNNGRNHKNMILHSLLDCAPLSIHTASLTWCAVLYTEQKDHISNLTRILWSKRTQNPFYVSLFYEVLGECSYFDNGEHLWDALQQFAKFVDHATMECDKRTGDSVTDQSTSTVFKVTDLVLLEPVYRAGFAWLLTRRGTILNGIKKFKAFAAKLSMLFGESQDWIRNDRNFSPQTRRQMFVALQTCGVLGATCLASEERKVKNKSIHLDGFQRLRSGSKWCSLDFRRRDILSEISPVNGRLGPEQTPPPLACKVDINDDVLSNVFSFLGYKRVVMLRGICSKWRNVADLNRLWRHLYQSRYPFLAEDKAALDESRKWKLLFQDMIVADREARASGCRGIRKHVVCRVVGCTKTFGSTERRQKHHEQHFKKLAKTAKTKSAKGQKRGRKVSPKKTEAKAVSTRKPKAKRLKTVVSEANCKT